ncbi:DMT family transporter [Mesorhizobium sp. L-8-3]|uniref:DMT family transporter n=1 Tax=Mesorhizobium sp. L-8-3 TaxID=2744522 RepID=UPI00192887D8|nr:multidrug efflux SMR transporter [Mesorhizobium sp. L-8-3]BCH24559.1 multidrug transporter [Mesorhizobium sp. L-8-3]
MIWAQLILAGLLEVVGAVGLKYTEGFTRPGFTAIVVVSLATSFYLLSGAAEIIPIGTAYSVWTGIGAAGTVVYGIFFLGESAGIGRLASLLLVIGGAVGMKLFS